LLCLCGGIVAAGTGTRAILVHARVLVYLLHCRGPVSREGMEVEAHRRFLAGRPGRRW
jgi:hypothetical protein